MTADSHIVRDEQDDVLRVPLPPCDSLSEGIGCARGNLSGEV